MFLILLFKLLTQFPFVCFLSISILSLLPFSILSLLPLHHSFFLFRSTLCPPKIKTSSFITFCSTNGTYFCILFHTTTCFFLNNAFYKLAKNNFLSLSSNLSYPDNFRNNYYIAGLDLENSKKGGVSQALFFQIVFLSLSHFSILPLLPFSILSLLPFLISPSLSTIPICSSDQFSVLLFMFHSVSLLSQAPLACGSSALPSIVYKIYFIM